MKQLNEEFEGKKEVIILKDSIKELEKLEKEGVKDAGLALENVIKQKIKIISIKGVKDVDWKIINTAEKQNAFIATNDKLLRKHAKKKGISTLAWSKSKKRIMVV